MADHTVHPVRIVTRGEFATALVHLTRIVGATRNGGALIVTTDAASSSAIYQDVQLVLGDGLLSLNKAGKFGADEPITGKDGVNAGLQRMSFL